MEITKKIIVKYSTFELICPYTIDELRVKTRKQDIVYWRHIAMWWRYQEGLTLEAAGAIYGRHHTTVINSIKIVNEAIEGFNPKIKKNVMLLIQLSPLKEDNFEFEPNDELCLNEAISMVLMEGYR